MSHGGGGVNWMKRTEWAAGLGLLFGAEHSRRGKGEPDVTKRRKKQLARREMAKRSRRRNRST